MAYTEKEFNYFVKKPKQINAGLDEDLLLALVDVNSSWLSYMKPHTLDFIKKVIAVDPTTFEFADRAVFTIQYLEEVISEYPYLIQYVYEPNDDLIKIALRKDLNVLQYFKRLPTTINKWILSQNGMVIEHIPDAEQTEELVEIAIRENIEAYKYAAVKNLYLDRIVLEINPKRVDLISDYHPELIEYLIDYNPRLITKFFDHPDNIVTDTLLRETIAVDSDIYRMVPNPDLDLMKFAATTDINLLRYMNPSQALIAYMIPINGLALEYLKKKDLRSIRIAIETNVKALRFVDYPRDFLVDYAFSIDGSAIEFIINPTDEQYLDAVQRNGYAIEFIPPEKQTKAIQTAALASAGTFAIPYIITPYDDDITIEIISQEPAYIFKIDNPTDTMYQAAFTLTGQLILFFDNWEETFSGEIIVSALTSDGTILEKMKNITKTFAMAAITSYPTAIQWVEYQDLEMATAAVEEDIRAIYYVDKTIMDEALLNLVFELDPEFFTRTEGELTYEQWLSITEQG